jgi:hypothetical protein
MGLSGGTASFLRRLVSEHALLRTNCVVCIDCCREDLAAGSPVYGRLLWCFQNVKCCPLHRKALVDVSQCCRKSHVGVRARVLPFGICRFCGREGYECLIHAARECTFAEFQLALEMANIIHHQDELASVSLSDIKSQLKAFKASSTFTAKRLAYAVGVGTSVMSYWLGQPEATMSLSRTILLAQALKIPLLSFFRSQFNEAQAPELAAPQWQCDRQPRRHVSDSEINTALEKSLRMGETPSSAALKLGVESAVIRRRSPALYDLVMSNSKGLQALKSSLDRSRHIDRARARYGELLKKGIRPTADTAGYTGQNGGSSNRGSTEAAAFQLIRIRLGETHLKMPVIAKRFAAEDWECVDRAVQAIKEQLATSEI